MYRDYVNELPEFRDNLLPTVDDLQQAMAVRRMIREEHAQLPVTLERFNAVVLAAVQKHADDMTTLLKRWIQSALGNDVPDEGYPGLYSSAALFGCLYSNYMPELRERRLYSYPELPVVKHVQEAHALLPHQKIQKYRRDEHVRVAHQVLRGVGLSEATLHEDVPRNLVYLCGKPGFTQPASFPTLVRRTIQ